MSISQRKDEHIFGALDPDVVGTASPGFGRWRLRHRALPGLDLSDVDLGTTLFGRAIGWPVFISSMTGGSPMAGAVNRRLAAAAEHHDVAMGVGSIRAAAVGPRTAATYELRELAPSVPLLANIGSDPIDLHWLRSTCDRLGFDALIIHLNPLQEAIQPEGRPCFRGAIERIARLVDGVGLPVMVKEVGFGLAPEDVDRLVDAGVRAIDVAGSGGTNWALVEGTRDPRARRIAAAFADWGWPTADAITNAVGVRSRRDVELTIAASGGIGSGIDAAVALCLGADVAGLARRLLPAAVESAERVIDELGVVLEQLRIAAFATGAATVVDLDRSRLTPRT
jgi:isopentenyl-diphosphate delta-isomerase